MQNFAAMVISNNYDYIQFRGIDLANIMAGKRLDRGDFFNVVLWRHLIYLTKSIFFFYVTRRTHFCFVLPTVHNIVCLCN